MRAHVQGGRGTARRLGAAAVAAALILGACSDDDSGGAGTTSGSDASTSSSADAGSTSSTPGTGGATSSAPGTGDATTTSSAGTDPGAGTTAPAPGTTPAPATTAPPSGTTAPPPPASAGPTTTGPRGDVPADATIPEAPRLGLDDEGDFGTGVTARLVGITPVQGESRGPGEVAGPSLRIEVEIRNGTAQEVPLTSVLVDATFGPDRTPANVLSAPDVVRFPPSVAPGESARAAYVFRIPPEQRNQIQVSVFYGVDAPILVFEGAAV